MKKPRKNKGKTSGAKGIRTLDLCIANRRIEGDSPMKSKGKRNFSATGKAKIVNEFRPGLIAAPSGSRQVASVDNVLVPHISLAFFNFQKLFRIFPDCACRSSYHRYN